MKINRRGYVMLLIMGMLGVGFALRSEPTPNDLLIRVYEGEITSTATVKRLADGETLFEETMTFEPILYPEDAPRTKQYENAFGNEAVEVTFDVQDGPSKTREFSETEMKASDWIEIEYSDSIDIGSDVDMTL